MRLPRAWCAGLPTTAARTRPKPGSTPRRSCARARGSLELADRLQAAAAGRADSDALTRVIRSALHGFVSLERERGFGAPLALDESYARLVAVLDRGLAGMAGLAADPAAS